MTDAASNHLKTYGLYLHNLGYHVIPIAPDSKAPRLANWQNTKASEAEFLKWCQSHTGCGILTANTVGVDIDCRDEKLTAHFIDFVQRRVGYSPYRVGMPPKALLPYRCDKPFSKVKSAIFYSPDGQKNQLEILGAGQQFVAAHIHPETKKPYIWHYADGNVDEVLTVPQRDLPQINEDDAHALIAVFELQCTKRGWRRENKLTRHKQQFPTRSHCNYTAQQVRDMLDHLDPSMPYDEWIKVGMALKHDGFQLSMWDEWSKGSEKYQEGLCLKKWSSFANGGIE